MMSSELAANVAEQYQAIRIGCGVVPLTDWSSVTLTGRDRQSFLHSFCTNDVKRLKPGDACEAFFTDVKGKIIGYGIISCREDELVIICVPGQSPTLITHLDRYLIREDVHLRDTTDERNYVVSAGGSIVNEASELLETQPEIASAVIPCRLAGSEFEKLIELSPGNLPELMASLESLGASPASLAFDAVRIEAGVPLFKVDFDESNLPQEVGRDELAISFTKGCYLGQETVARIDALGHVNQRIVGVRFMEGREIDLGTELTREGRTVGRVSSGTFSPKLNAPLALAMVRREANAVGARLDSAAGECEVIALPLL
jgi:folate-binding protein YgfZ